MKRINSDDLILWALAIAAICMAIVIAVLTVFLLITIVKGDFAI